MCKYGCTTVCLMSEGSCPEVVSDEALLDLDEFDEQDDTLVYPQFSRFGG